MAKVATRKTPAEIRNNHSRGAMKGWETRRARGAAVPSLLALATTLRRAGYRMWQNVCIGGGVPCVTATFERMENPVVGDFVFEATTTRMVSSGRWPKTFDLNGVGILEEIVQEPINFGPSTEPWNEAEEGRPHPMETIYYIRTLDGRRFRWENAKILAIVTDLTL